MIDTDGVDVLDERECRWLLGQEQVGRVAIAVGDLPALFPVNYAVVSDEILFFTGEGTKLRAATSSASVSFEVDHIDLWNRTGWSVLVAGHLREVTEPVIVAGTRASGLRPWAEGDRSHLLALSIDFVSGRRIAGPIDVRVNRSAGGVAMVGPRSPISAVAQHPIRIPRHSTLQEAAKAMSAANASSVLVDPDTAILTERDLTRALNAGMGPDTDVALVSVSDLVTVDVDATVVEAAGQMLRHEIRHLVVCNHRGGVVGLVSLRDIIRILLDAMDPAVWVMLRETMSMRTF